MHLETVRECSPVSFFFFLFLLLFFKWGSGGGVGKILLFSGSQGATANQMEDCKGSLRIFPTAKPASS